MTIFYKHLYLFDTLNNIKKFNITNFEREKVFQEEDVVLYVLKNNNGKRWYNLKTTMCYDKAGAYKTIQEACDFIIELGGRILTFESNGADDCIELKDILLSSISI